MTPEEAKLVKKGDKLYIAKTVDSFGNEPARLVIDTYTVRGVGVRWVTLQRGTSKFSEKTAPSALHRWSRTAEEAVTRLVRRYERAAWEAAEAVPRRQRELDDIRRVAEKWKKAWRPKPESTDD